MSEPVNPNPYASPSGPASQPFADIPGGIDYRLQQTIRNFRSQSLALGVAWIVLALLAIGLIAFAVGTTASRGQSPLLIATAVVAGFGIIWITVGTFTCLKHLWAIYTGLVLSYISLVGNLLSFNLCAILILLAIIVQAHRVLGFAKQIQAAGLPLNAKV
jgi:hypothetical protein